MTARSRVVSLAFALLAIGIGVRPAAAQSATSRNHSYDKWQFIVSGTNVVLGSTLRVDGSQGNGTEVDAENDLGLDRSKLQPRFAMRWRPGHRHELELGYQFAQRSGEKQLTKDIIFGDSTYHAGLVVKPTFNSDQAFLIYRFAFMAKERTQIGAALGIGPYFFKVGLDALASVSNGSQSREVTYSQTKSVVGPTGALGLYGRFRVGDRWYIDGDLRYISVSIDRFTASVIDAGATGRYFVSSKVGFELGYGLDGIKVDVGPKTSGASAGFTGKVKFSQQNFRLGVVIAP